MFTAEFAKQHPEMREFGFVQYFAEQSLEKGRTIGIRKSITRQGTKKFGPPSAEQEAALLAITDESRLEAVSEKLLDVDSWAALLGDQ